MSGLPEVECLIAVLNRVEKSGEKVGSQKKVECIDWFQCKTTRNSSDDISSLQLA